MEKQTLELLIAENLSQREIGKKLGIGQTTLRYWLDKFELKTRFKKSNTIETKIGCKKCSKCKKEKLLEYFYPASGYCKSCHSLYSIERLRNTKLKMIAYKGNECNRCKLNIKDVPPAVFEFHHIDPKTKDPDFNRFKSNKMENIKPELDKCILVCANCHRIIHAEMNKNSGGNSVVEYHSDMQTLFV